MGDVFEVISGIIAAGQLKASLSVHAVAVHTYWQIGRRIVEEEQQGSA